MERVFLKPGREKTLERRHPWIFSGALAGDGAAISAGETVAVCTAKGDVLGFGSYSPESQIRVRMLSLDPDAVPGDDFITRLVAESCARRQVRNSCRLINAENDGLPGVIADCYAGWIVCQFTSAGAEYWKRTIASALMKAVPGAKGVAERGDADARRREGLVQFGFAVLQGDEPPELVEIEENGVKFFVDVRKGHKTGFYLDQREARETVGRYANGRDVLNCFCYTGGFGIYAAKNGARSVTQVDASAEAISLAQKNATLNGDGTPQEFIVADVFKLLRKYRDSRTSFDMIILDPPKFAESKSQVMKAARGYKDINLLAMKLLRPGGILATFSCSGAIDEDLFNKILAEAAADAKLDFQIIGRTGQPSDHPVSLSFPEGRYLKGIILQRR